MPPELGYPENDYNKGGPRPTTFSVRVESLLLSTIWIVSEEDAMQICVAGPTGLGFCAKEPRIDRQDSIVWYRAVEDSTKLICQILHWSWNISIYKSEHWG